MPWAILHPRLWLSRFLFLVSNGASQVVLVAENPPVSARDVRDTGSIPGSGRSPGGGHGNPLLYSCLGNPIDRGGWQAAVHRVMPMHARAGPGHPLATQQITMALAPLWPKTSTRGTADPTSLILQVCQDSSQIQLPERSLAYQGSSADTTLVITTLNP